MKFKMLSLEARLLCAASHAYKVFIDGPVRPTDESPPRSSLAGYLDNPVGVTEGPDSRDAALVADMDEGVLLAFRGTVPPILSLSALNAIPAGQLWGEIERVILDWSNDTNAMLRTHPIGGRVHQGFAMAFYPVWIKAKQALRARLDARPDAPVLITGHSKGGAMAVMAAAQFAAESVKREIIVRTFAAPRLGDAAFAAAYATKGFDTKRYEYAADIVPHLPLTASAGERLAKVVPIPFVEQFTRWEYSAVGQLEFIDARHLIEATPPPFEFLRWGDLGLADIADPPKSLVQAHSIGAKSGYADAVGL